MNGEHGGIWSEGWRREGEVKETYIKHKLNTVTYVQPPN